MTSAGTPRPCPPSAVADQILTWAEVQGGDLVLHYGELNLVAEIKPGWAEDWLEVQFTDGSSLHVPGHHLTAVRRYTEGERDDRQH